MLKNRRGSVGDITRGMTRPGGAGSYYEKLIIEGPVRFKNTEGRLTSRLLKAHDPKATQGPKV